MSKIKVANPIVEIDGDEMARIIWKFIKEKLILDYIELDVVYYEIREGDKVRTQSFKGVVIQIKGRGESKTFTIRKMSGTVGVERIFPLNMPALNKIEVNKKGKVRQSRIYYFRDLRGKKARIKEV